MAPREIRDRRRVLRYRNLLVRQAVQMKNKVSGLLMEAGVPYNQQKVHQKKYFAELLQTQKKEMPPSMPELLRLSRSTVEALTGMQRQLIRALESDALLAALAMRAQPHQIGGIMPPEGDPVIGPKAPAMDRRDSLFDASSCCSHSA